MDTPLFLDALNRAQAVRGGALLPTTISHSSLGSQYTSDDFREILKLSEMPQSMPNAGEKL